MGDMNDEGVGRKEERREKRNDAGDEEIGRDEKQKKNGCGNLANENMETQNRRKMKGVQNEGIRRRRRKNEEKLKA